jgi:SulP family sulfate permease
VAVGPGAGVGAGILLATVVFLRRLRSHTLRWHGTARARPSRRVYPPALEQRLLPLREHIALFELEGTLFWGNAERVSERVEALPGSTRIAVLDLRRVGGVDESAAFELHQLAARLAARGCALWLAGPPSPGNGQRDWGRQLAEAVGAEPLPSWPDADRATEAAERLLLAREADAPPSLDAAVAPEHGELMRGLDAAQWQRLRPLLQPLQLRAGQALFRAGDPAEALYLLVRGSVSVLAPGGTRYVSFSPGTELGELALLDGGGRSADAVADDDAELLALPRRALERLFDEDPALAALLLRRLAQRLAERLRSASNAWHEAAG